MNNFKTDAGHGFDLEDVVADHFREIHPKVIQSAHDTYFPGFDMEVWLDEEETVKLEVKLDRKAFATGNTVVEVYKKYRDQLLTEPGGLTATKSEAYITGISYPDKTEIYITPTKTLKDIWYRGKYQRIQDYTGDGNATVMVLDLEYFKSVSELLFIKW